MRSKYVLLMTALLGMSVLTQGCGQKEEASGETQKTEAVVEEEKAVEESTAKKAESPEGNEDAETVNDQKAVSDLPGEYVTDDGESGELIIEEDGSGYRILLTLYRLTEIEGSAEINPDNEAVLDWSGTDASGAPIKGTIEEQEEGCLLTVTDTSWEYLQNGDTYYFYSLDDAAIADEAFDEAFTDTYIYEDSNACAMTEGDVALAEKSLTEELPEGKSIEEMILNEIYARHGYRFEDPKLQAYFDGKQWYLDIGSYSSDLEEINESLNDFEKQNVEFLKK